MLTAIASGSVGLQAQELPGRGVQTQQDPIQESRTQVSRAKESETVLSPLFEQAAFWQARQRSDLAAQALQRVLESDPQNQQALYRLGRLAIDAGEDDRAERWLERLREVAPDGALAERLRQALDRGRIDPAGLSRARALAAAGNAEGAAREYERLFGDEPPPWDLAPEYYETLAGTDGGWERARAGLEQLAGRDAGNAQIALALARVLSYRKATRRESINDLGEMPSFAETRVAWRQALLWLDATEDDQRLYERYLQRYPDDQAVREYFLAKTAAAEADPAAQARQQGYEALDEGELSRARTAFEQALADNDADADALAGLGLIALRRERFAEARDRLGQAIQAAPAPRDDWVAAFRSASFYAELDGVRQLAAADRFNDALAKLMPLTNESGQTGRAARLLAADLERRRGNPVDAERWYRRVLNASPGSVEARQGLVVVLRDQQRWQEATMAMRGLSATQQAALGDPRKEQARELRAEAGTLLSRGQRDTAHERLSQALALTPEDPWIRLDLARLYQLEDKPYQASFVMSPVLGADATPEALQAGAMLAAEQSRWADAETLIARLPADVQSDSLAKLRSRVAFGRRLQQVREDLANGHPVAREALYAWYRQPPSEAGDVGSVAMLLLDAGQPGMALEMVRRQLDGADIAAQPGAYLNHVLVLARAGHGEEARALLGRIASRASESGLQARVAETERGLAVMEADRLRGQQRYAEAYDVLQPQLQASPDDTGLLLALGRLYTSGDMPAAASTVYDRLLERAPENETVLAGAVNAALAQDDTQRAEALLVEHAPLESPALVVLAARTSRAQGDRRQAIALLEKARGQLDAEAEGLVILPATSAASISLASGSNPFRHTREAAARRDAVSGRTVLSPAASAEGTNDADTRAEVERLLSSLESETATYLRPGVQLRLRDGESGLSELTSIGGEMRLSASPFKRGRLEISLSPEYISAGEISGSANDRYGTGTFTVAAETLQSRLANVSTLLDSIQDVADSYRELSLQRQENPDDPLIQLRLARAAETLEQALQRNPFYEAGIDTASLSGEQLAQFRAAVTDFVVTDNLSASRQSELLADIDRLFDSDWSDLDAGDVDDQRQLLERSLASVQQGLATRLAGLPSAARDPGSISDAGVGLDIGYRIGDVSADIGATPQGFEQSNIVGGIAWQPKLSRNTQLSLKAERRAVKDSVLSYAGVKDPLTGETWGAVTRTGGEVGITYDDGGSGAYASAGAYVYQGEHVADNHSVTFTTGAYVRPINESDRQLQVGVNLGYMGFDKNLRYFTYGHGGYFSPQNYVSLSLPISYEETRDRWRYRLSAAPGFQSYEEDDADIFPDDADAQSALETLTSVGLLNSARYRGESESGFGITLGGRLDYELAPNLSVGGALGYDSFGDYSETSASLFLDYRLEGQP
ncbi:cellulose biosynthesis protein BcsC [Salinicola avicenniae]|uniref:cellulose biosynthesis protein BcsC n=1 Tax=Salinicola avicenniae TaxID=2916836 RepID=UPI002073C429|nr:MULTISPECIES: cellulose biosynthesis protein BcsC [unclassified Salinicola]